MYRKCKTEDCKCRGVSKYDGYCKECFTIKIQQLQLQRLEELHENINKLRHDLSGVVVESQPSVCANSAVQNHNKQFIPTIDKPVTSQSKIQTSQIKTTSLNKDNISSLAEALKNISQKEESENK